MDTVTGIDVTPTLVAPRLDALARCSEEAGVLTRTWLTPAHRAAADLLGEWMRAAGMDVRSDAVGNVIGRYEGVRPGAPALMIGSHYDTVRNAGRFDGALGIVAGIACVDAIRRSGRRLDIAVEVVGFADEEGTRFGATLLGSRAVSGGFDQALLELRDAAGVRVEDAMVACGLDPGTVDAAARRPQELAGYVEVHIEQGPVLEALGVPLGVVTAIAGATRLVVDLVGVAGHAGTVPMGMRRDAALAAAEVVLAVERRCSSTPGLVGTVGKLEVPGGALNVVPGRAILGIDVRAPSDPDRQAAVQDLLEEIGRIGRERGVTTSVQRVHDAPAVACAPWMMSQLAASLEGIGVPVHYLPSGAGHDAMAMAQVTDVAMLFVRCGNGGISHHPDEIADPRDMELATRALVEFVIRLGRQERTS